MSNQPKSMQRVFPMIAYEDVASAADWMTEAFGFREAGRWADSDGRVTQLEMEIGGATIMLGFPVPTTRAPATMPRIANLLALGKERPTSWTASSSTWTTSTPTSIEPRHPEPRSSPRSRTTPRLVNGATASRMQRAIGGCSLSPPKAAGLKVLRKHDDRRGRWPSLEPRPSSVLARSRI